jgi:hypothetical protein
VRAVLRPVGAAPGATTVVRFILESGSTQPLAGAWQLAQACLLLGIDNFSSKKTCFPNNSIGSSATASPQTSRKGRANAEATSVDFIFDCIIASLPLDIVKLKRDSARQGSQLVFTAYFGCDVWTGLLLNRMI